MENQTHTGAALLQPRLVRLLMGVRKDTVWHQDSPGVRVDVIRNNLTRLWRSPEFSEVGETHYLPTVLPPNPMPTNKRLYLPNDKVSHEAGGWMHRLVRRISSRAWQKEIGTCEGLAVLKGCAGEDFMSKKTKSNHDNAALPNAKHSQQRLARRTGAAHVPEVEREEITTANGLLYHQGQFINLPEADSIAIARGYQCAEQLVRALEAAGRKTAASKPRHSPSSAGGTAWLAEKAGLANDPAHLPPT